MRKKTVEEQTHIRVFTRDKFLLRSWMKKRKIHSQAQAIRILLRKR
jgi:hypothetical protein